MRQHPTLHGVTHFGAGNLYKDLFSIYLQASVKKNS